MEKAISETCRRRKIQMDYNNEHGIVPKTINKNVSGGVIETLRGARGKGKKKELSLKLPDNMDLKDLEKHIAAMKKEMKLAASELRFEDAAKLRDEIKQASELRLLF